MRKMNLHQERVWDKKATILAWRLVVAAVVQWPLAAGEVVVWKML